MQTASAIVILFVGGYIFDLDVSKYKAELSALLASVRMLTAFVLSAFVVQVRPLAFCALSLVTCHS